MYDLRTMLATYYTLSKDNAPTPEEMRRKSRDYMLMKPKKNSLSERETCKGKQQQKLPWFKPRDDMEKLRFMYKLRIGGSSSSGLHNKQTRHEKLGIRARRGTYWSNGKTRVLQWFDYQNWRKVFFLQSRGPFQDGLSPVLGGSEESRSPET